MYTRVLLVGNDPSVKGGITSVITQILSHDWESENIDMTFIPTYIETNTVNKILYYIKAYIKIRRLLKNKKIDVVHIHMSYRGSFYRKYLIHKLCRKYQVRDIVHLHGSEFKKWYDESNSFQQSKIRKLLNESSSFIVLGNEWNETIKEIEPSTNTIIVSNTVAMTKEIVTWNEDVFQILFLGVLLKRKGVEDLLKAITLLKDHSLIGKIKVIIAGEGEEKGELKDYCNHNNLNDIVDFVGWIDGKKKVSLLKESQMLVLPSYNEGLPIAILEAISYGMPIVASDVGDVKAAVHDGENGYLIKAGDVEMLSECIYRISSNKELYESMGNESKKIAKNNFSDEKYFKQLKTCYEGVQED